MEQVFLPRSIFNVKCLEIWKRLFLLLGVIVMLKIVKQKKSGGGGVSGLVAGSTLSDSLL